MTGAGARVRLATVWLAGCSGCHMSLLDMDERLIDLDPIVDLVYSPFVDATEFPDRVDVTLVEGAVATVDQLEEIRQIRNRTRVLVAFGDCAVMGNVTALRNPLGSAAAVLERAYIGLAAPAACDGGTRGAVSMDPATVPALLDRVLPVGQVVHVDFYLPGCPPSADLIHRTIRDLAEGRVPDLGPRVTFG